MRCSCQDDGHLAVCYEQRPYAPRSAYKPSKAAITMFAVEAARRWAGDGITVNAVMPDVVRTN
ncbi:SDR family NAD(P)-dependent oxidoreductase [Streptomyces sp. NPDC001276]|uniref:SDR family NAD(P)-dependent oxidoreductase n=1 Tax=Streptomyces sp. NPDC001276 TaxID=3364555 RepID=UPI003681B67B